MNISANQIRNSGVVAKTAVLLGLLVLPAATVVAPQKPAAEPVVVRLPAGVAGAQIQRALDNLPNSGGEVVLPPGNFEISQPIVLRRDHLTLRGSGPQTILHLADSANCPVIIMGEAVNRPQRTVKYLCISDLFIDGNRHGQQRELWRVLGEGSEIRNNGITVQNVSDSVVEHVTCARCRSGGVVTTRGVRRLTVSDLTAFDNQFDGLACYQTTDSLFSKLHLHDNPGAGISLDLAFKHNVISNAVLTANDLGIFMRDSRDNRFHDISIYGSRHYGVFMAQAEKLTSRGWQITPRTECAGNSFTNLLANDCGSAAIRVNNPACTNNVIVQATFDGNPRGQLSLAQPNLLMVR